MLSKFILFGDSLTQRGFEVENHGWVSLLSNEYNRKFDIINRGYSGYNSEWCRYILPQIIKDETNVKLFAIFLGANDAVLENARQHVSSERFRENMRFIVKEVQKKLPIAKLLLITPPPIFAEDWELHRKSQGSVTDRDAVQTDKYSQLVRDIGVELSIPVVDVAKRIKSSEKELKEFFVDGLHFSATGNRLLYDEFMQTIKQNFLDLYYENVPWVFPYHGDVDVTDLANCFNQK